MNNEIIVISTTKAVTESVIKVLENRQLEYPVFEATMSKALEIANREIENGTKVIVCRGGTATYLRGKVDVPVVDIRHGFIDIYQSVEAAKAISKHIGIIGYSNLCEAAEEYKKIMKEEILIDLVFNDIEFEEKLEKQRDMGIKVVIGGFQLSKSAPKFGMTSVMGEAEPVAINQSIDEALHDLKIEHERRAKFETINAILNCTSEGIIAIEESGKIIHINTIAQKILGYKNERYINEILPKSKLLETAMTGQEFIGEFLKAGSDSIIVSSVPIKTEHRIVGAVATIQEEVKIQDIDREIRKKNLGIGHFAKKTFNDIIGSSNEITQVIRQASKYAKSDSTVLILGETGTGKEIFAQSIHNYSKRRNQPFVAINCAALPENILESELFGYVRGAFTGANKEGKSGIFELAHNGTVFLDEIGEVSTAVQVKLLRVLQEKEVSRIGDDKVMPIDVRVLAATNKDLLTEIQNGRFREDLYFRLCVLELDLPPLRSRIEDIKELCNFFAKEKSLKKIEIPPETVKIFEEYHWPGNIRQLSNVIERLIVTCDDSIIDAQRALNALKYMNIKVSKSVSEISEISGTEKMLVKLIEEIVDQRSNSIHKKKMIPLSNDTNEEIVLHEGVGIDTYMEMQESKIILTALNRFNGNREKTANFLGISKPTLWRKIKKLQIENLME